MLQRKFQNIPKEYIFMLLQYNTKLIILTANHICIESYTKIIIFQNLNKILRQIPLFKV